MEDNYIYPFEKLRVWQESRQIVKEIYLLTNTFPKMETFGLVSQMRRSAISISSNIAEGSTRVTRKDQAKFSNIAYSSLTEMINQLIISVDLGYISTISFNEMKPKLRLIANQLIKLRRSQLKDG